MEERNIGTCAVAAPVFDQVGSVIATLCALVPTGRFGPDAREKCAQAVRGAAAALSGFLGLLAHPTGELGVGQVD